MARKVEISKEVILQAALDMLIRDGYSSINIKTLAKEIGCSTQPIVWHFDNMEGLRKALAEYARAYANNQMFPTAQNAVVAFEQTGIGYVKIAAHEPNLFRFLYLDGYQGTCANNFDALISNNANAIIYTHGIAALVATGVIKATEEEMMELVNRAADAFIVQEGVPADQVPQKEE